MPPRFPVNTTPRIQVPLQRPVSKLTFLDTVPVDLFGWDHWNLFRYVEERLVERRLFRVQCDPRMRCSPRHYDIFERKRDRKAIYMAPEHGSKLNDGTYVADHDDWDCVQDCVTAGLLICRNGVSVGKMVKLSKKGRDVSGRLRQFISEGGSSALFRG